MKKAFSLLLALAMCLSLAACGGKNDSKTPSGGAGSTGGGTSNAGTPAPSTPGPSTPDPAPGPGGAAGNYVTNYPIFNDFQLVEALSEEDLAGTTFSFAGGQVDGVELEEEDANAVLEMYGGALKIEFPGGNSANLVQGGGTLPGTYTVLDDGGSINFTFELNGTSYDYVGAFTMIDEVTAVLVFVSTAEPTSAFYMALGD